jgi:hypothetical protein
MLELGWSSALEFTLYTGHIKRDQPEHRTPAASNVKRAGECVCARAHAHARVSKQCPSILHLAVSTQREKRHEQHENKPHQSFGTHREKYWNSREGDTCHTRAEETTRHHKSIRGSNLLPSATFRRSRTQNRRRLGHFRRLLTRL